MGNIKTAFGILIFIFLFPFLAFQVRADSSLSISPDEKTVGVGSEFNVEINVDTGGENITGVDAIINYDPKVLKVSNFEWKTILGESQPNPMVDETVGRIMFHPATSSASDTFIGKGSLASITFKAIAGGKSEVTLVCNSGKTQGDSNIWSGGNDIIDCSLNKNGAYTVGKVLADSKTSFLAQAVPPGVSPTPEVTELTEAGTTEITLALLFTGFIFLVFGTKLLLAKSS